MRHLALACLYCVVTASIVAAQTNASSNTVRRTVDVRTTVSLSFTTTAPTTTDTVVTALIKTTGGVAAAGTTSITATAGKTLRLTAITTSIRATAATTPWALAILHMSSTTTCTAASPVATYAPAGGNAAVIGNTGSLSIGPSEGYDLVPGGSFCLSVSGNVATNVLTWSATGYEY